MPRLKRPDGVEIDWETRGDGPPVVIVPASFSMPVMFSTLIAELVEDHVVLTYDLRGTGESTRAGPYEMQTDAEDLAALLEEATTAPAVLVAAGDASHRSIHAAVIRPESVRGVVCSGVTPLGAQSDYGTVGEGLASSAEVVGALLQLLESDYRAGLRTAVQSANPQHAEDELRRRLALTLEYAPQEATVGRLRAWIEDDARESARALGDRLWMLYYPGNAWFPAELAGTVRREAPQAHVEEIANGALSRPDITAAFVRQITHC